MRKISLEATRINPETLKLEVATPFGNIPCVIENSVVVFKMSDVPAEWQEAFKEWLEKWRV